MRRDRKSDRAPSGFTLLELLITIAIIAILAALLIPALASAKYHGQNARCKSNLRQIGLGLHMYTQTHSVFPPDYSFEPPPTGSHASQFWSWGTKLEIDARETIVPNPNPPLNDPPTLSDLQAHVMGGVFRCPLNKGSRVTGFVGNDGEETGNTGTWWILQYNAYGYNAYGSGSPVHLLGLGGTSFDQKTFTKRPFRFTSESSVVSPDRRAKTIYGHFRKAADQLVGAIKRIEKGVIITHGGGETRAIKSSDFKMTHAIVLVTASNWKSSSAPSTPPTRSGTSA